MFAPYLIEKKHDIPNSSRELQLKCQQAYNKPARIRKPEKVARMDFHPEVSYQSNRQFLALFERGDA